VHGTHVRVPPWSYAALRPALEHEHDDVLRHVGDEELLVQAARCTGSVLPPPVGAGADDVGRVDDQDRGHGIT
jgi:hypothetical protein